jgi:[ribosomal protein S5]-alanine N-acetyltransferase
MLAEELPVITWPPIVLRPFGEQDAGVILSVSTDPLVSLFTTATAGDSLDAARAYIQRQHDRLASGAGYSFAIADAATGDAVGQIGLWLRHGGDGRVSTSYWVASRFRRRGYASAALAAISRWGLSRPGIHRIDLYVEPSNQGSWRAAEHAGYRRESLLLSRQQVGAERQDMYMYSLVPHDLPVSS